MCWMVEMRACFDFEADFSDGGVIQGREFRFDIDDTSDGSRPFRTTLRAAGIPVVEYLCNLSAVPNAEFRFWAVPPKIRKMGTFPVRAHARLNAGSGT